MTVHVESTVTVGAPPPAVWAALEPIESHVEWMADAVAIRFRSEEHAGVGAELECETRVGPLRTLDVMQVVEWEPGRAMGIEHRGLVTGRGRFTLTFVPGELTELTWREELRFPWWAGGALAERLARPLLARIWRANLHRFRARAEAPLVSDP